MSQKLRVISDGSSDEETVPLPPIKKRKAKSDDPPPLPPKTGHRHALEATKRANKHMKDNGIPGEFTMRTMCGQTVEEDASGEIKFTKNPSKGLDNKWQNGMETAFRILQHYQVDGAKLTLLPDHDTLDCFKKVVKAHLVASKTNISYTFTSFNTFQHVTGRLLLHMVLKTAGLAGNTNIGGCVVWEHGCQHTLKCLHGSVMIQKEQLVEMDVNSENAQRVLKENPEKAKIVPNRWGRNVVQVKNQDAFCCQADVNMLGGNFSGSSCGMFYTDGGKALIAFQQLMAFQKACYPNMKNAETHMFMPVKCECNWNSTIPTMGRQVCKITPFNMPGVADLNADAIDDPKLLATLNNPAVLVFQCCNPVHRSPKGAPSKNCDFKISSIDIMTSLQVAKQIWKTSIGEPHQVSFPEFKWSNELRYQATSLPQVLEDQDESLF